MYSTEKHQRISTPPTLLHRVLSLVVVVVEFVNRGPYILFPPYFAEQKMNSVVSPRVFPVQANPFHAGLAGDVG